MKALFLVILIPVLLLVALRYEMTGWRLFSPAEYAALQVRIAALEEQGKQAATQRPQISDGTWMAKEKKPSSLDRPTPGPSKR